jgi:hypothetical protein
MNAATAARQTAEANYNANPTDANLKAYQTAADVEMDMVLASFDARNAGTTYTNGENTEMVESPVGLKGQDAIDMMERLGGTYNSRKTNTHEMVTEAAESILKRVCLSHKCGVVVEIKNRADSDGWMVVLHSGTGSSYGNYYPNN